MTFVIDKGHRYWVSALNDIKVGSVRPKIKLTLVFNLRLFLFKIRVINPYIMTYFGHPVFIKPSNYPFVQTQRK